MARIVGNTVTGASAHGISVTSNALVVGNLVGDTGGYAYNLGSSNCHLWRNGYFTPNTSGIINTANYHGEAPSLVDPEFVSSSDLSPTVELPSLGALLGAGALANPIGAIAPFGSGSVPSGGASPRFGQKTGGK